MKILKSLVLGVGVMGLVALLSSGAFAEGKHHKIDLGLIKNAAVDLQATHPDLAAGLTKYVDEETKEEFQKNGVKEEKEGAAEEKEEKGMKGRHEAIIKLFKDSAAALQTTHSDLAAILTKSAEWKEKKLNDMKEGKEDTRKGETNEAKQ